MPSLLVVLAMSALGSFTFSKAERMGSAALQTLDPVGIYIYGGIFLLALGLIIALIFGEADTEKNSDSVEQSLIRRISTGMAWLANHLFLPLDLRALAVSRIFTGCVSLYQCYDNMLYFHVFINNSSICHKLQPNGGFDLLTVFQEVPWALKGMLTLHFLASGSFTLGAFTRLSTFILFCSQVVLHERIKCIGNAGDLISQYYFFWVLFLPAGARWSVNALRASAGCWQQDLLRHAFSSCRAFSYIFLLELSLVYYMCGFQKDGPDWEERYDAAWYATQSQFGNEPFSSFLRQFPWLLGLLTKYTLYVERYAWILLFIPLSYIRLAAVTFFIALHMGFHVFLRVGLFQLWMLGFLFAMLPAPFFEILEQLMQKMSIATLSSDRITATSATMASGSQATRLPDIVSVRCSQVWSHLATAMLIICCTCAWPLYWAHASQSCGYLAPSRAAGTIGPCIQQVPVPKFLVDRLADAHIHHWRGAVFADKKMPKKLRWNYILGYTSEGSIISLWNGDFVFDGQPFKYNLTSGEPRIRYSHSRVRKFFARVKGKKTCVHLTKLLCGSSIRSNQKRLLGFEIIDAFTPIRKPFGPERPRKNSVRIRCRMTCDGSLPVPINMTASIPISSRKRRKRPVAKAFAAA